MDRNTEYGQLFYEYASRGELVPDEVTVKIWHAHIRKMQAIGAYKPATDLLILDGIPRSVPQAKYLEQEIGILKLIHLVCHDEEAMIERLRSRALKENRTDDAKEEVIRHRWEVYRKETAPILEYYPDDMIAEVDALKSPAEVLQQILAIVVPIQNAHYQRLAEAGVPLT